MSTDSSYPSPVSVGSLGDIGDEPARRERRPQERGERRAPHRNGLQNAAASLEAAFARLEQVRASLVQLSDRLSDPNSPMSARGQLGPGHESILLAGASEEDPSDYMAQMADQTSVVSGFQDSFRRAVQAQNSLTQLVEQTAALRQAHPSNSPGAAPTQIRVRIPHRPLPPGSQVSRYLDLSVDDSSTALGRRVAETLARGSSNSTPFVDSRTAVTPIDTPPQAPSRGGRPDLGRLDPLVEEALSAATRASQTGDLNELRRLNQIQNQLASPAASPLQWRQDARRRRNMRAESRQTTASTTRTPTTGTSDHLSRLSVLSNFSLNNFSPSSPNAPVPDSQRPLLFEEPESIPELPPMHDWELDNEFVDSGPFERSYVVRRRVDIGGAERVQNIQLDWDEMVGPLLPHESDGNESPITRRRMLSNFHERTQRNMNLAPVIPGHGHSRRRGWARLDADGNEIPSDEEEELERHRAEYRTHGSTAQRVAAMPSNSHSTRLRPISDLVDEARVLYRPRPRTSDEKFDGHPFTADPLPMPLSEMITIQKPVEDDSLVILVPRHASFAGR